LAEYKYKRHVERKITFKNSYKDVMKCRPVVQVLINLKLTVDRSGTSRCRAPSVAFKWFLWIRMSGISSPCLCRASPL